MEWILVAVVVAAGTGSVDTSNFQIGGFKTEAECGTARDALTKEIVKERKPGSIVSITPRAICIARST